jgi:hypothetical protein
MLFSSWPVRAVLLTCALLSVSLLLLLPGWTQSLTHLRPTQPKVDLIHPGQRPPNPKPEDHEEVEKPSNEAVEVPAVEVPAVEEPAVEEPAVEVPAVVDLPEPAQEDAKGPTEHTDTTAEKSHLRNLCDNTEWTEGLWLSCHSACGPGKESVCGGLNNARNRIQSCLRLAIDAGAGLVLPTMLARSEETLGPHDGAVELCTSKLWNSMQLAENLKVECPQLNLRFCGNTTGLENKITSNGTRHYNHASHTFGTFRKTIENDLKNNSITEISADNPVRVDFFDGMFSWNYTLANELETIRKDLFKVLPYNPDILELGKEIFSLMNKYSPFVGIHFRGEGDWPPQYGTADQQMAFYSENLQILRNSSPNVSDLYISCGDQRAIQRFRDKMEPLNYTVHDKWTLLNQSEELLTKMNNLTFDQKGIVEYETLTAADYFIGAGMSSMSLLIAFTRTVNDTKDWFTQHVLENSTRSGTLDRKYPVSPIMKGDETTQLLMLSGSDIMDRYP